MPTTVISIEREYPNEKRKERFFVTNFQIVIFFYKAGISAVSMNTEAFMFRRFLYWSWEVESIFGYMYEKNGSKHPFNIFLPLSLLKAETGQRLNHCILFQNFRVCFLYSLCSFSDILRAPTFFIEWSLWEEKNSIILIH